MSTQNIFEHNKEDLYKRCDDAIICMADNYMIKSKFGIGEGYDKKYFDLISTLQRLLCEDNCLIIGDGKFINEKINIILSSYE